MKKLTTNTEKFRLACYVGDPNTPLSLSRGLGPLLDMARQDRRLELVPAPHHGQDLSWSWLNGCDALFMEQPYSDQHVNCVYTARYLDIPVWLDWGDDLYNINKTNPARFVDATLASKSQIRENLGELLKHATVVTTATETLRQLYGAVDKTLVLPEACRWPMNTLLRRKVISWRGLSSHEEDVEHAVPQLLETLLAKEFDDWQMLLMGAPSNDMVEALAVLGKRLRVLPYLPTPWHMMSEWAHQAPFLHVYPLSDNPFNRSKPPTIWLETAAIGAGCIGPDLPEWKNCNGLVRYAPQFFGERLREELRKFEPVSAPSQTGEVVGSLHPGVALARAQIYPHLCLPAVNELRWAVLNKLVSAAPWLKEAA